MKSKVCEFFSWNQYTTLKSEFFFREIEKKLPAEGEKSEAVVEVGLEDAKVDACDLRCWWLEKLCSRAEKQNKLLLSLLCEIKSQLFVYNFKTIKIIIYFSLERSDPYDLCYYCSCQMRLLENLYWKNVNLQKKISFFPREIEKLQ